MTESADACSPQEAADAALLLGVDGGGTKTAAWLARHTARGEFEVLGKGCSGSSNIRAVGWASAQIALQEACDQAWQAARIAPRSVRHAVLALAGSGRPDIRSQWRNWALDRAMAHDVEMLHDADAVLYAGTPEGCGVAMIAGTGSSVAGVDPSGRRVVVGGWGWRWGDEGSAFWIGREALKAVARADDGRCPATSLGPAICSAWNAETPRELLGRLEMFDEARRSIADLAPLVAHHAQTGDEASLDIVRRGAAQLAELAATAVRQLNWAGQFPLALAGGVLTQSDLITQRLLIELQNRGLAPEPVTLATDPVEGCLRKAALAV
ncbi:MAG: hypothetical protein KDA61_17860 [Planctomycetales bacterium]|nr:hypothetical protein [Planctomycetales bacterium]